MICQLLPTENLSGIVRREAKWLRTNPSKDEDTVSSIGVQCETFWFEVTKTGHLTCHRMTD